MQKTYLPAIFFDVSDTTTTWYIHIAPKFKSCIRLWSCFITSCYNGWRAINLLSQISIFVSRNLAAITIKSFFLNGLRWFFNCLLQYNHCWMQSSQCLVIENFKMQSCYLCAFFIHSFMHSFKVGNSKTN